MPREVPHGILLLHSFHPIPLEGRVPQELPRGTLPLRPKSIQSTSRTPPGRQTT